MRCNSVRKNLNAYLDAELSAGLCLEMATHLQCCQSCRHAWVRLRQVGEIMQTPVLPALPQGFADRVLSQARQQVLSPSPAARASLGFIRRWKSVPLAQRAAAAAVLLFGLSTGVYMGRQTGYRGTANRPDAPATLDDPVAVFNLDYFAGDPNGSLPHAYLSLVSVSNGSGE